MKKRFFAIMCIAASFAACSNDDEGTKPGPGNGGDDTSVFEEFDDHFVYHGESYNIKTFENGSTWMVENLRYIPEGYTPSADAAEWSGVWYPYKMDYDQIVADGALAINPDVKYIVPLTDAESVKKYGYLYNIEVALTNGVKITEENCYDFEGAQGICPDGWHIPTRAEYFDLVGLSNKNALGETGNQTNESALFYDAGYKGGSVAKANAAGFNYGQSGVRMALGFEGNTVNTTAPKYQVTMLQSTNTTDEDLYGKLALSYYMTSTCYKPIYSTKEPYAWYNTQFFALMSTYIKTMCPEGKLSLTYASVDAGQGVRCVKDSAQ